MFKSIIYKIKSYLEWESALENRRKNFFKNLLVWQADIALRYSPVVDFIKGLDNKKLKILEVGSSSTGIANFLKQRITNLDKDFTSLKLPNVNYVKGKAQNLPFSDRSFDLVICLDVLEHILPQERLLVVQEAIRVSRGLVIISFPCGLEAEHLDKLYYNKYYKKYKKEHSFAKEHINLKPVDYVNLLRDIEQYLKNKFNFYKINEVKNINVSLWKFLNIIIMTDNLFLMFFKNLLLRTLFPIIKKMNKGNTYRRIYFISFSN